MNQIVVETSPPSTHDHIALEYFSPAVGPSGVVIGLIHTAWNTQHFNMTIFNGDGDMALNWETQKKYVADKSQLCYGPLGLSFDYDGAARRRHRRASHDNAKDESRLFESRDAYTSPSSATSTTNDERDGSPPLVRWMKRVARRREPDPSAPGEQIEEKGMFRTSSTDSSIDPSRLSSMDSIDPSRLFEHDDGTRATPPGTPNAASSQASDDDNLVVRRKSWPCHRDSELNSSLSSIIKPRPNDDPAWSGAVEDGGWVASGVTFSRTVEVYVFEDPSCEAPSRSQTR